MRSRGVRVLWRESYPWTWLRLGCRRRTCVAARSLPSVVGTRITLWSTSFPVLVVAEILAITTRAIVALRGQRGACRGLVRHPAMGRVRTCNLISAANVSLVKSTAVPRLRPSPPRLSASKTCSVSVLSRTSFPHGAAWGTPSCVFRTQV